MPVGLLDCLAPVFCLSLSLYLYKSVKKERPKVSRPQGYILHNQVTHARLLPEESRHSFTYPTIALLVSLDALEQHQLDLVKGWVFGYGNVWGRLTGLRPAPYLARGSECVMEKLQNIIKCRGFTEKNLRDAWMMTMPSFVGFEGINPLTVYFCYTTEGEFWLTVLEVGAYLYALNCPLIYVRYTTLLEKAMSMFWKLAVMKMTLHPKGLLFFALSTGNGTHGIYNSYDHEWTFNREFHVSPFNDRSGFYAVSIKSPSHPPMVGRIDSLPPPKPSVRVHQYTASEDNPTRRGTLKLTALLRPTHATPLTAPSWLFALTQAPFALLLTFPRILYVAGILHYAKRLDVFLRPDPLPAVEGWNEVPAGGVRWLDEGATDRSARKRVEGFLTRRSMETKTTVILVSSDPHVPEVTFAPTDKTPACLTIYYTSPRFFSVLFLSPSADHALLLGCDTENIFQVSDKDLFLSLFSSSAECGKNKRLLQRMRCFNIPQSLDLPIPATHYLDEYSPLASGLSLLAVHVLDWFEKRIFSLAQARVVEGQEPWKQWERAAARRSGISTPFVAASVLGSVRRG